MNALLKPFELLYRGVNRVRRELYRARILRPKRLKRPVISVGNIAAGGAGKTPAVIRIAQFLSDRGLRVAVLTRGYGRASDAVGRVDSLDAAKFGDEPVLIKKHVDKVDVIVGKRRYGNAVDYLRDNDCDVFVLDDGFQHMQLRRDLDVVIDVDGSRFHREGRSALRSADIVIPRRMRTVLPSGLNPVAKQKVFAFAALADNDQFFAALRAAGLDVAGTRGFRDHHRYTAADLASLKRDAGDAVLVTTEKDAVKIDDPSILAIGAQFDIDEPLLEQIAAVVEKPERRRKRRKHPALQRVEYWLFRAASWAVGRMSEEGVQRWGGRLGALGRRVLRKRDALGLRNLRAAFPGRDERELREILDGAWRHFGREAFVYLHVQNHSLEEITARCDYVDAHHVHDSVARGNGTLLISAHLGSWETGGLTLLSMVDDVRMVARPLDNALIEASVQRFRAKTGAEVIDRRRAARGLMRALAENAMVVLLPDQAVQPREGVLVPFVGRPAWTTPAPAKMAIRGGSTIVIGFCIPDGLRYRIEFHESIRIDELRDEERDPMVLTTRINTAISNQILARPDLYLWMHDRWKSTEGEVLHGV
jgi:tetraacyldisaccharide-1-P 4'-kinase/lauroyl/myristoyl acyltransferase